MSSSISSTGKTGSTPTMMGGGPGPLPPVVVDPNAPAAPLMDAPVNSADAAKAVMSAYIQGGGKLRPVPSGFWNETVNGAVTQHVYYRHRTQNEKGTQKFWIKWIWTGCQDWELHVHYNTNGKPGWINFAQGNSSAYTGLNSVQETLVRQAGAREPPKDT
jgi:hypothetical protein